MQTFMGCACVLKASFMACALTSAPSPEVHAKECLPAGCLLNKRIVYQFQRRKPTQPVLQDWQVMQVESCRFLSWKQESHTLYLCLASPELLARMPNLTAGFRGRMLCPNQGYLCSELLHEGRAKLVRCMTLRCRVPPKGMRKDLMPC